MIDWNERTTAFDDTAAEKLCKSRGYSKEIVAFLRENRLVGLHDGLIAFVTEGGAHFKVPDGSWRFTDGAKASLFVLGSIEEGAHVHCFESQWDAIAFADASGEHHNIVATRGASNARLLIDSLKDHSGVLYLWPQNDDPGRKWADDIRRLFPGQIRIAETPQPFKDLCQWWKQDPSSGAVLKAYQDAKDLSGGRDAGDVRWQSETLEVNPNREETQALPAQTNFPVPTTGDQVAESSAPSRATDESGGETNLTAVPVLAEPKPESLIGRGRPQDSEARESTKVGGTVLGNGDSRGGGQSISTLAQALDAIEAFFNKYVRFPEPWHAPACSLWAAYTWVWKAFDFTPYLLVRGPEENCGKTRVLKCLQALSPKVFGGNITCNVSGPAMFREIEDEQPVFLLDEVDKFFSFGSDDPVVGLLNAGYERGGTVIRNNVRTGKNEKFSVFCPKAFAGIGDKIDNTTASRAIHIHMARQNTNDMAEPLRSHIIAKEVFQIRMFLQVWSIEATEMLRGVFPALPSELANDGRKAEITEPLVAVADMAGADWGKKARENLVKAFDQPKDDSLGTQLLRTIKMVFDTLDREHLTTQELVDGVVTDHEGPWASWWERDMAKGQWRGAATKVAKMLKPYRIHSQTFRTGEETHKGYHRADFERAWKTYVKSETRAEPMELKLI